MISITQNKKKRKIRFWAVAFWLLVWQVASMAIGQEILLVSPVAVLQRLGELIWKKEFWASVGFSLSRIAGGFLLGMGFGVLLGGISAGFDRIKELFAPLVLTMKSIPVASFVILALIWIPSENLSVFISFFMVFPVVYTNVQQGMERVNQNLLEMAQVFQVTGIRRIRYIYLSQVAASFPLRLFCGIGTLLEGRGGGRSYRNTKRFYWRAFVPVKSVFGNSRFICLDSSDYCYQPVF